MEVIVCLYCPWGKLLIVHVPPVPVVHAAVAAPVRLNCTFETVGLPPSITQLLLVSRYAKVVRLHVGTGVGVLVGRGVGVGATTEIKAGVVPARTFSENWSDGATE